MTTLAINRVFKAHEAKAHARGFTRFIQITSGLCDLAGWVRPHAKLDGRFTMICAGEGETLQVNGGQFSMFEDEA